MGQVLSSAQEEMEKRYALLSAGFNLKGVVPRVSAVLGVTPKEVWAKGKCRRIMEARSLFCYWEVRELGMPMSSLSRRLGISTPSVSDSVTRGQRIAEARNDCFRLET
ncbi:MAG: hypothetical protein K9N21_15565 [Deltaproteobacteria bacterium]|nr:hypothetical protein [Deltaproteobacteria bacterium]